jgi:uncharacterized protein (TIGR03000 family)
MYGLVLATMLTAGGGAPDGILFNGCHGCYGCYGCYGCWGCHGCYGCWGCHGCYGCWGCYGCYGCYGCWGCHGYAYYAPVTVYYYPVYSCCGCWGGCCGTVVYPAAPVAVAPAAPAAPAMPKAVASARDPARATVLVKAPADVTVTVNGQATTRRSTEETFLTPPLESGKTYAYVFKAEATRDGAPVSRTRRITVRAGQRSEVDFTDLRAEASRAVAQVTVLGPGEARVIVDGVVMGTVGTRPTFETPMLEPGRKYFYTVKAELNGGGATRTASKRVTVEAGKAVTVDFRDLAVELRAAR